ncbi:MAG TPA: HepT-like ribonuclease domain-containing protein [Tepidisphaeraceae bacterium]|jgi:uncharacterized protein with HEPN domain
MPPEIEKLLFDMRSAALGIRAYIGAKTFAEYLDDPMLRHAVERQFEIIGEAMTRLRRIDPQAMLRITDASHIIAFRNRLIHGYDVIDHNAIWTIIRDKLPQLITELKTISADEA